MADFIIGNEFSPWAKPVGMLPTLARYQALTGLRPIGPHRAFANRLLKNITCKCPACNGSGLHGTYGGLGWLACPTCNGFGEAYCITLDALQALRIKVLDRYPGAAPGHWKPGFPIRCPVLHLKTGLIIEACGTDDKEPVQLEIPLDV